MALENLVGTDKFIANLVNTNPTGGDDKREGDDHIRGVKNVLKNTFPNLNGAVTATDEDLNTLATGMFKADDGTAGAPSYSFTSDTNIGLFRPASDAIGFSTVGVEKMRLMQYADGTLLVNGTASLYALAGRGDVEINGASSAVLGLNIAGAGGATIGATALGLTIGTANNTKPIIFAPAAAESARLTAAAQGELLVNGQSALTYSAANRGLITVDGSAGSVLAMGMAGVARGYLYGGATGLMVSGTAGMVLMFGTSGTEVARIDTDATFQYAGLEVGWRDVPQHVAAANINPVPISDRGKMIVMTTANACTFNTGQNWPAGAIVSIVNKAASGNVTINGTITINWGTGTPATGPRVLAVNGIAELYFTALNVATLTGSGIS